MRGRSRVSHNVCVMMVSRIPGAASAHSVGSTMAGSPLCQWYCIRRKMNPPPTIIHAQDSAPLTMPLCQGDRMNRIALHGHQTKVGTKNQPW